MKTCLLLAVAALALAAPTGSRAEQSYALKAPHQPYLLVRHERGPGPSVLYVHGATFPSGLSVSYRIDGLSWMDDLRRRGFDVWTFDFAGFGGSERDEVLRSEAPDAPPYGRAANAARQIARVVAEIVRKTGHRRVDIVAHSWGTIPAGMFAADRPDLVERLVLFGPVVPRTAKPPESVRGTSILVGRKDQWESFAAGMPDGKPYMDAATFEAWDAAYLATDRDSARRTPIAVRVPSGPAADIAAARGGQFPYDRATLKVPTLIVRGEWDPVATADDVAAMARALTNVPGGARAVTLPKGGHRMHLERNRLALFDAVAGFLARPATEVRP